MTDQELESLVCELNDKLNEVYRLDPLWKKRGGWPPGETGSVVYPPASDKDIRKLEKRLKKEFPPSYVRFLRLHNGWTHFWMDFTLLGAVGEETEKVLDKVSETEAWQRCVLTEDLGELTPSRIREWEARNPSNLYLENHLAFGTDFAGSMYVFDSRTRQADGEMVIRHWSIANGASSEEFYEEDYLGGPSAANFDEFLSGVAKQADKYLARLKRSKGRKKK